MNNKKGFAISAILYSIIIIAILIFLMFLAISRNTRKVDDQFVSTIKDQLNETYILKNPTPFIAFEFDLNLGGSYVNINNPGPLIVYTGTYASNFEKINEGFKDPDYVLEDMTYTKDLNDYLPKGLYTVVSQKFTGTGGYPTVDNLGLIGVPHADLKGLKTTTLRYFFRNAKNFNQNINDWDVSGITSLQQTFYHASSFNQPLNSWDISNVTSLNNTFSNASSFNQPLNNWDTSKVTNMEAIFSNATLFNQNVNNWDTSKVTTIRTAFYKAENFNQPLNNWDVSKVTTLYRTFRDAKAFNQPLNAWDTSNVTIMTSTFDGATNFNQNINNWNTSKVTNMDSTFLRADSFNQPLNNWDVSKVTNFRFMLGYIPEFNQNISDWNTSSATDMSGMFISDNLFNQNLTGWCVSNISTQPTNFAHNNLPNNKRPIWGTCPNNKSYTVKFNLNGGSGSAPDQLVLHGTRATAPATPTRSGYNFGGWSPSILTNITSDTTFTANWSVPTYSVAYFYEEWDYNNNYYDKIDIVQHGASYKIVGLNGATRYYDWDVFKATGQKVYYNVGSTYTITKKMTLMHK